jgi:hypothetical protein
MTSSGKDLSGSGDAADPGDGRVELGRIGGMAVDSLAGRLLVATPALKDPNFERTVVMIVAHEPGGSIGVVLNRATEVAVADVLDGWDALAEEPGVVFEGGPLQPEAAICIARSRSDSGRIAGFNRVSGTVGTLDLSQDPETVAERANSRPKSRPGRGSSSRHCRATRSCPGQMIFGRWCCAGRAG